MIAFHHSMIFQRKLQIVSYTMIVLYLGIALVQTNFYLPDIELRYHHEYYMFEYGYTMISFWKIGTILYLYVLLYIGVYKNNYDCIMLSYRSKRQIVLSKLLLLTVYVLVYVLFSVCLLTFIPLFVTPYFEAYLFIKLTIKMILFSLFYLYLMHLLFVKYKNLIPILGIVGVYLFLFLMADFGQKKEESSTIYSLLNIFLVDINNYSEVGYDFLFGKIIVVSYCVILFIASVTLYESVDM